MTLRVGGKTYKHLLENYGIFCKHGGRPNPIKCIHPPIDNELWKGIYQEYKHRPEIISKTHVVNRIKAIDSYDKYQVIIEGCRLIAKDRGCYLFEVKDPWQGNIV